MSERRWVESVQLAWFGLTKPQPLYGRLGFIHCDEQPAVELLEIVTAD